MFISKHQKFLFKFQRYINVKKIVNIEKLKLCILFTCNFFSSEYHLAPFYGYCFPLDVCTLKIYSNLNS